MPDFNSSPGANANGRRLRTVSALTKAKPYLLPNRSSSANFMSDSVEITNCEQYIAQLQDEGHPGIGVLHVLIAAYIRTVAAHPGINRFVQGQRVMSRDSVEVVFTVQRGDSANFDESTIKVSFDPRDTVFDVHHKLTDKLDLVRSGEIAADFDRYAASMDKFPRVALKFGMWFLRILDYFGALPAGMVEASPYHGSLFIMNLGTIGVPPVYQHLSNFGNMPVYLTFGGKRSSVEITGEGKGVRRRYIDYCITFDERACDSYYFTGAMKTFKQLVIEPQKLAGAITRIEEDIF